MTNYPHIASRLFNTPLAVTRQKAEIIRAAVANHFDMAQLFTPGNEVIALRAGSEEMTPSVDKPYGSIGPVAVIPVYGTLVHKSGYLDAYCGITAYETIRDSFLTALDDPAVEAIMLDCDSPGGEVSGCFDLVDTIFDARGDKPIWSILSESAYSACYAIASAADVVTVPRTGGTGSVGVIVMHADFSGALKQAGVDVTIIQYGDRKSDFNEMEPLSKSARDDVQAEIDMMGDLFVETVARNRDMKVADVRATEAGCYLGALGVDIGFADVVAAPDHAIADLIDAVG